MKRRSILLLVALSLFLAAALAVANPLFQHPVCDEIVGWDARNDCAIGVCVFKGPHNYLAVTYLDLDGNGVYSGHGSGEAVGTRRLSENPCE